MSADDKPSKAAGAGRRARRGARWSRSSDRSPVGLLSIRDLLREMNAKRPWTLAIAQRPFEWSPMRVTNLVDSILRGFPIGALLLVESTGAYYDLDGDKKLRVGHEGNGATHVQILDGQQRCLAIRATFGGKGLLHRDTGQRIHLWINLSARNHRFEEFDQIQGQRYYLHWSERTDGLNGLDGTERRQEKLPARSPAGGWVRFAELVSAVRGRTRQAVSEMSGIVSTDRAVRQIVREVCNAVDEALRARRIPVHTLPSQDRVVHDLHQVFVRINTGGVALSPVDEFFAGAKHYWKDAEAHLRRLVAPPSLLDRRGAITVLARCAARSLPRKPFDPYRLNLRDLARAECRGGNRLVRQMQALAPPRGHSDLVDAVNWVSRLARRHLHQGAEQLSPACLGAAMAWALRIRQRGPLPDLRTRKWSHPIIRFLFWTEVFGSRTYGRRRFDREVFEKAWFAGGRGDVFPYDRDDFQKVCYYDYARVQAWLPVLPFPDDLADGTDASTGLLDLMKSSMAMFLSVFQQIDHSPVDWDHILADAYARRRFREGRRIVNRRRFRWVGQIGNFAGIDRSANRVLQDLPPSKKFGGAGAPDGIHYGAPSSIKTDPCLTAPEKALLREVEVALESGDRTRAGLLLEQFSASRSLRIWRTVVDRVGPPPAKIE